MKTRTPSAEQTAELAAWRTLALERMPYMARILFALRPVDAPGLGTFAVDDKMRLYIDFDVVSPKGATFCSESLLHEASHVLQDHSTASVECNVQPDQRRVFNVAADASINDDLIEAGCTSFTTGDDPTPANIGAPDHQTPHFYFAHLTSMMQKKQQQNSQSSEGSGHEDGQSGGSGGQQGQDDNDGQGGSYAGCGSGSGGEAAPCELDDGDDMGGKAPAASDAEKVAVAIAVAADIRDHIQKGRGSVPAGMADFAAKTLEPSKTPWQKVLRSAVRRALGSRMGNFDTDRSRRHRRRHRQHVLDSGGRVVGTLVVPGMYEPVPSVEFIRDTSGSMSSTDLAAVTREVTEIAKRLGIRGDDLVVTDVDAEVHQSQKFTGADSINAVKGRGGTDMTVGIKAAWERTKNRPAVIVVGTDGYTPWPTHKGPVPVIAAIICAEENFDDIAARVPPFIRAVQIDPAKATA